MIFRFYFYEDVRELQGAYAVVADCIIDSEGEIYYTDLRTFPASDTVDDTREDEGRDLLIESGIYFPDARKVNISLIERSVEPQTLKAYPEEEEEPKEVEGNGTKRQYVTRVWGMTNTAEAAAKFGNLLIDRMEVGEIKEEEFEELLAPELLEDEEEFVQYFFLGNFIDMVNDLLEEGWRPGKGYDCYYVGENEQNGHMHLKYYFYPEKTDIKETREKALVLDVYLSGGGLENIEYDTFLTAVRTTLYDSRQIQMAINDNAEMIMDYLSGYEGGYQYRWFELSAYDFNRDGEDEIILSRYLLDQAVLSVSTYNYVYDSEGNLLTEYFSTALSLQEFYYSEADNKLYMKHHYHVAASYDVWLYGEMDFSNGGGLILKYVEWDTRDGAKRENNSKEEYAVLADFTKEEVKKMGEGISQMVEVFKSRKELTDYSGFQEYKEKIEGLKASIPISIDTFTAVGEGIVWARELYGK